MGKSIMNLIQFTGKNYNYWAFQLELYLKGKKLRGHISGSKSKPFEEDKMEQWKTDEAQIMSWILASVDPHFLCISNPTKQQKKCGITLTKFIIKKILRGTSS